MSVYGSNSFHQRAGDVYASRLIGFVGQALEDRTTRSLTLTNSNPQAAQVTTMAVSSYSDGGVYTFTVTVGGSTTSISYTATTADSDTTGVATSIVALFNDTETVRGLVAATSSTNTITFTGQTPGISFTVSESDAKLGTPSTTTSAASADTVSFGRAMIDTGHSGGSRLGHVPTTASFSAQVITITVTTGSGATFTPQVSINGLVFTGDAVAHNTDAATTATDIAAEINAIAPAETVIATTSSGSVIITAEVEGAEFEADILVAGAAFDATKVYTTGPSRSTSLRRALAGVSMRDEHVENLTRGGDDPAYPANYGVKTLAAGRIVVSNDQSISLGDDVYVSLASATKGQFYNTAATDRVYLPPEVAEWDRDEPSSHSADIAVLRINTGRVY